MQVPNYKMKFFEQKVLKVKQKVEDLTIDLTKKSKIV